MDNLELLDDELEQRLVDDDESDDEEQDPSDHEEASEEDEPKRKGDLSVALKAERQKRQAAEREIEEKNQQLNRQTALMNALGQQNQAPRKSQEEADAELQELMLSRPSEYHRNVTQQLRQELFQQNAPIIFQNTQFQLANDPDFKDLYKDPHIKQAMDELVEMQLMQTGRIDPTVLENAKQRIKNIRGGAVKPSTEGKEKLTSTVNKGSATQKSTLSEEAQWEKALKLSPKDYTKWEKANKDLVSRVIAKSK